MEETDRNVCSTVTPETKKAPEIAGDFGSLGGSGVWRFHAPLRPSPEIPVGLKQYCQYDPEVVRGRSQFREGSAVAMLQSVGCQRSLVKR